MTFGKYCFPFAGEINSFQSDFAAHRMECWQQAKTQNVEQAGGKEWLQAN